MRATTTSSSKKTIYFGVLSIVAALMLVISWLVTAVSASSVVQVTSNVTDVPGGESLVITVGTQNDGDIYELEVDHSLESTYPEFSVYADEADPYGGDGAQFAALGVTVTYSATDNQWVIDLGDTVTQGMASTGTGEVRFHFVLKDVDGNVLWGSMSPTSPENTFAYNLVDGTGDTLLPSDDVDEEAGEDEEVIVPGVPNTAVGR